MKGRRLWMRVQTAAGELRVYATTLAVENDDGEACDATFDPDTHTIEVRWRPDAAAMKLDLHHELIHRCFHGVGGDALEKVFGRVTRERREAREEAVVSFLDRVQFDLLTRNGFLRYPNPPRLGQ